MKIQIILLLFLFSCKSSAPLQTTDSLADIKNKISGKWSWQITKVCQRGNPNPETPESCKCKKMLVINTDGTVKIYTDGIESNSGTYTIKAIDMASGYYFNSDFLTGIIKIDENNLSISTCAVDGIDSKYIKIK